MKKFNKDPNINKRIQNLKIDEEEKKENEKNIKKDQEEDDKRLKKLIKRREKLEKKIEKIEDKENIKKLTKFNKKIEKTINKMEKVKISEKHKERLRTEKAYEEEKKNENQNSTQLQPREIFENFMEDNNIKYIGGFCTGFTVVVLFYLIIYSIGLFFIGNIYEIQGVEPATSLLQQKQSLFLNNNILIHIRFNSYAGDCSVGPGVYSSSDFHIDPLVESLDNCSFIYNFQKHEMLATGDNILFKFDHKNSFTSDINIYLELESEFPNQKSGLVQSLNSSRSFIFRGNTPTVFYYTLTPAYFKETTLFDSVIERKGFRLSQNSFPEPGSQHQTSQIYFNPGLSIKIELTVSDSAIVTYRVPISDLTTFIVSLLAQVNGTFGLLVFVMVSFIFLQKTYRVKTHKITRTNNYDKLINYYKNMKNPNRCPDLI